MSTSYDSSVRAPGFRNRTRQDTREKTVSPHRIEALVDVIEAKVIPQIRKMYVPGSSRAFAHDLDEGDVRALVGAVLGLAEDSPEQLVDRHLQTGISDQQVCLQLLAPAAAMLGSGWLDDDLSFYQVTIATTRLQHLLHALDGRSSHVRFGNGSGQKLVLAGAPGEQHLFGLAMLEFFFRHEGWETFSLLAEPLSEVVETVRRHDCDIVAFSCSCDGLIDDLASAIRTVRAESVNRDITVMVGGYAFSRDAALVDHVGADAFAGDAPHALDVARSLVSESRSLRA